MLHVGNFPKLMLFMRYVKNLVQPPPPLLEYLILLFCGNSGYVNMPQCYLFMDTACLVSAGILKIQPAALSGDLMHDSVLIKIRNWSFRAPTK
jgi:hypothetical protein